MTRPLEGHAVVVTRAQEQQGEGRRQLEALGAEVIDLPALVIVHLVYISVSKVSNVRIHGLQHSHAQASGNQNPDPASWIQSHCELESTLGSECRSRR